MAKNNKKGGWLDAYQEGGPVESRMGGLTDQGFNYNGAWGGQFQDGGLLNSYQNDKKTSRKPKLNLASYNPSKGFLTAYGNAQALNPNVNLYTVGAYGEKNISPELNISGNINTSSVLYPGGDKMFMKPAFNVGLKYKFEDGGDIQPPMAQTGRQVSPLYVSDANDPRYKSYSDSLYSYNVGQRLNNILGADENYMSVRGGSPLDKKIQEAAKRTNRGLVDNTEGVSNKKIKSVMKEYQQKANKGILPVRYQGYIPNPDNSVTDLITGRSFLDMVGLTEPRAAGNWYLPQWKKPEVQVIVDPSRAPKPKPVTKPTPKPVFKKPVVDTRKTTPEPVRQETKSVNVPQTIQSPKTNYNQGTPVYAPTPGGGGGAFVGFKDKSGKITYVQPDDYERMGVPAYGKKYIESQKNLMNGGSLPGATGNMYTRTGAPSNGPYAKKTLPSAQSGKMMSYYQQGLDFEPKTISENGSVLPKAQVGLDMMGGDPRARGMAEAQAAEIARRNRLASMETSISPARPTTDQSEATRIAKNKAYKATNPNAGMDEKGNLYEKNSSRDLAGRALPNTRAAKLDKASEHTLRALDAASYVTGAGALTKTAYNIGKDLAKKATVKSTETINRKKLLDEIEKHAELYIEKPEPPRGFGDMVTDKIEVAEQLKNFNKNVVRQRNNYLRDVDEVLKAYDEEVGILGKNPIEADPTGFIRKLKDNPDAFFYESIGLDVDPNMSRYIAKDIVGDYASAQINANLTKGGRALLGERGEGLFKKAGDDFGTFEKVKPWQVFDKNFFIRKNKEGGVIKDDMGQWAHPGEITEIDSPYITMEGIPYPVLGISDVGDTQMMYPGEDYEFEGDKVTEIPMAQNGIATRSDSLEVYNNAMAIRNYYDNLRKKGWYKTPTVKQINFGKDYLKSQMDYVKESSLDTYRNLLSKKERDQPIEFRYFKNVYPNATWNQFQQALRRSLNTTLSGKNDKYYYKDLYPSIIDPMAPSTLVNLNILPNEKLEFEQAAYRNDYNRTPPGGSITGIYSYNPLSVKPYDLRTPEERIEWDKRYNRQNTTSSQTTTKPKPKPKPKPAVKKEVGQTKVPEKVVEKAQVPERVIETPKEVDVQKKIATQKREVNDRYVFGPAGSVIGVVDKNKKFTKADMPEQRAGVNKADLEILKNEENLGKYIKSKGLTYEAPKKKNGGWLNDYE